MRSTGVVLNVENGSLIVSQEHIVVRRECMIGDYAVAIAIDLVVIFIIWFIWAMMTADD